MRQDPQDLDHFWMREALKLADQAGSESEVPVGALLVREGRSIAQAWNQSIRRSDPTAHAEMLVLRHAAEHLQNYRLPHTTLYVTLEPCCMCAGALVHARVERLVFGAYDLKSGAVATHYHLLEGAPSNHRIAVTAGILATECAHLLTTFFKERRKACSRF